MTFFYKHKRYFAHLFCCCFFVFIGAQKLGGTLLFMGILLFVLGCMAKLFNLRKVDNKKQWLRDFRNKLLMWCSAFAIVFGVHQYYKHQVRQAANKVLVQIERFHRTTGAFPSEKDLDERLLKKHRIFYQKKENKPSLVYIDTFMIFAGYHYDFDKKQWVYLA